jgi:hypothetical protein
VLGAILIWIDANRPIVVSINQTPQSYQKP